MVVATKIDFATDGVCAWILNVARNSKTIVNTSLILIKGVDLMVNIEIISAIPNSKQ